MAYFKRLTMNINVVSPTTSTCEIYEIAYHTDTAWKVIFTRGVGQDTINYNNGN